MIPVEIGELNNMRYLWLEGAIDINDYEQNDYRYFTGEIPSEISTIDSLRILDLNFNKFEGEVSILSIRHSLFAPFSPLTFLSF